MGLLDTFKQYIRDAMPGGLLNQEWTPERVRTAQSALLGMTPVVGGVSGAKEEWDAGNPGWAAFNAATVPLDLASAGLLGGTLRMAGKGGKYADILSNEISNARVLAAPRSHTLPNGIAVNITPSYTPQSGAVTGIDYATDSARYNFPSGYVPHNSPMFRDMTQEQRAQFISKISSINSSKRDLIEWKDARDYVLRDTNNPPTMPVVSSNHADAAWWESALTNPTVNSFAQEIKGNPAAFRLPLNSKSADIGEIIDSFNKGTKKEILHRWEGENLVLYTKDGGSMSILGAASDTPVIRSINANSQGKKNGSGADMYQIAYNWLTNNGKQAYPDSGLSEINQLRKTGNVLAAQVRNGDIPAAVMNTRDLSGAASIPQLFSSEAKMAVDRVPGISGIKFDGKDFFLDGKKATDSLISKHIAKSDANFSQGVGAATAKRYAVHEWLKSATPKDARKAASNWRAGALFPAAALVVGGGLLSESSEMGWD